MKFSKEEKEIVKAIVQCENQGGSLALALNFSRLLEKQGIAFVDADCARMVFLHKDLYPDFFPFNDNAPYVSILLNLIEKLVKNGHIILGESCYSDPLVIGAMHSQWAKPGLVVVNGNEFIIVDGPDKGWYGADKQEKYFWWNKWDSQFSKVSNYLHSDYCVSEELKELVKNDFKTDEEIRFVKQQLVTWISIGVAILLGVLGIIF